MIKKTLVVGGALVLLSMLFFGTHAFSVVSTVVCNVQDRVEDTFSPEFKLDHARRQIAKLGPEINRHKRKVAKEEVAVENLQEQVSKMEAQLTKDEGEILRLKADLDSGGKEFVYTGTAYSRTEVQDELRNRFDEFQMDEETLKSLQAVLKARNEGLAHARAKIKAMETAKSKLIVKVDMLAARLKKIEVAKAATQFEFDDSRLAKTRDLVNDLEGTIRASEKLVNVDSKLRGRIQLDGESENKDISERVANYFNNKSDKGNFVKVAE